jgi:hypothetical protein
MHLRNNCVGPSAWGFGVPAKYLHCKIFCLTKLLIYIKEADCEEGGLMGLSDTCFN